MQKQNRKCCNSNKFGDGQAQKMNASKDRTNQINGLKLSGYWPKTFYQNMA